MRRITLFIILNIPLLASAQVDIFGIIDSTYNAHIQSMEDTFDNRISKIDEDFYKYLRQSWEAFPVIEKADEPSYADANVIDVVRRSIPQYTAYKGRTGVKYSSFVFSFFEETVNFQIDNSTGLSLAASAENNISEAWKKLSSTDFYSILNQVSEIQNKAMLNDWGVYELFRQLADYKFTSVQANEKVLFISFLMNQAGYDTKMGRMGKSNKLLLLLPFHTSIKRSSCIEIDGKIYTIVTDGLNKKAADVFVYDNEIYTYRKNHPLAKYNIDLELEDVPLLGNRTIIKQISTKGLPLATNSKITLNKGLCDFYNSYPNTVLSVYLNTPMSIELKQSLYEAFKPVLKNKDKVNTIRYLLKWFHASLPYQDDKSLLGHEQAFFPEQTLNYAKGDCEDRSILFARIVKEFIGLDVLLLAYTNHVAAAVCFDKPIEGYTKNHRGKVYTVCDPSYIGGSVGEIADTYKHEENGVIELKK